MKLTPTSRSWGGLTNLDVPYRTTKVLESLIPHGPVYSLHRDYALLIACYRPSENQAMVTETQIFQKHNPIISILIVLLKTGSHCFLFVLVLFICLISPDLCLGVCRGKTKKPRSYRCQPIRDQELKQKQTNKETKKRGTDTKIYLLGKKNSILINLVFLHFFLSNSC